MVMLKVYVQHLRTRGLWHAVWSPLSHPFTISDEEHLNSTETSNLHADAEVLFLNESHT